MNAHAEASHGTDFDADPNSTAVESAEGRIVPSPPVVEAPPAFLRQPRLAAVASTPVADHTVRVGLDPDKTLIIPAGVRIKGDVFTDALYLCGEIEGKVTVGAGQAIIAATGKILGQLDTGGSVSVAGKIEGEGVCLRSIGEIDIGAEAEIRGDIEYTTINLRGGALVEGRLAKART